MDSNEHAELSEKLVCQHLCRVIDISDENAAAWILLQEPGFIGFGAVYRDKICWPQHAKPLDWARIRDLRLFGEKGEWHVWPHWNGGWKSRLLKLDAPPDYLTEYHVLWGTEVVKCKEFPWIKLSEERGTEIWLPLQKRVKEKDLPLRLKIKQVIGYDDKGDNSSHLAGIVDAALVALVDQSCKKVLPPLYPFCSKSNKTEEEVSTSDGDTSDTNPNS